jgi:hypothetical protein
MSEPDQPATVAVDRAVRPGAEAHKCVQACGPVKCQNMRCTYEGMDGERYRCDVCGHSYFLDYGDMQ